MSGVTITLSKPIKAHGEDISEITLREPSVEDTIEVGQPFLIIVGDGDTGIRIQNKTVAAYIVRLAGVPLSSVKAMSLADFGAAQAAVLGFFGAGDGEAASSSKNGLLN